MNFSGLDVVAHAARKGDIDFGEFAKQTAPWWGGRATKMARWYALPGWFERDDIRQELLLLAWLALEKYDAKRGTHLGGYLDWSACKGTLKRLHKVRGVNQHRRRGPSRFEVAMSRLPEKTVEKIEPTYDPWQERSDPETVETRDILSGICEDHVERFVVEAVVGADELAEAGRRLYADPRARLCCALRGEAHARNVVSSVVEKISGRYSERQVGGAE